MASLLPGNFSTRRGHASHPAAFIANGFNGSYVLMSLRGPNPLTADPHVSTGLTPGVGVLKVLEAAGMPRKKH